MAELLQFLLSGLTVGAVYALVALGFTIIYNASDVVNFAQGEFVMLGGMITFFAHAAGVPLPLAALLAIAVTAAIGVALNKLAIEPARGAPLVSLVIITIGASIFIRGVAQVVFYGQRRYAVREPAAHPVYDDSRVQRFRDLLLGAPRDSGTPDALCVELGALMVASHESYGRCGLGSAGTDRLVALVCDAGPAFGLYGAKITGGGSGGTVAVLGRPGAERTVRAIADAYGRETGRPASVLVGSSHGAVALNPHGFEPDPGPLTWESGPAGLPETPP